MTRLLRWCVPDAIAPSWQESMQVIDEWLAALKWRYVGDREVDIRAGLARIFGSGRESGVSVTNTTTVGPTAPGTPPTGVRRLSSTTLRGHDD